MRDDRKFLDGEFQIYPGHPITIAWIIVNVHPTYEDAFGYDCECKDHIHTCRTPWPRALSNNDIPGAGGNVYTGLDVLKWLREGLDPERVFKVADSYWVTSCAVLRRAEGQAQAQKAWGKLVKSSWWHRKP